MTSTTFSGWLLLYVMVGALAKEQYYQATQSDPCALYTSCSSCTEAHYYAQQTSIDQITHPELRGTSDNKSMKKQKRLLRRGNTTKTKKEDKIDWPHRRPTCIWCPKSGTCTSKYDKSPCSSDRDMNDTTFVIQYEYNCPLGPTPYPDDPPSLLPDWMGALMETGSLNNLTLVDLSLPGTHDSLTYDLSLTVSEGDGGEMKIIEALLHKLSGGAIKLLPGEMEDFFRLQAKTQQLTVTQQLDNGIRFIDFRLMMESVHHADAWYSIHFMQSKQKVQHYFQEIRDWMDLHPNEIVAIWLSKHGSTSATGNNQYPDVTPEQKQRLWSQYVDIFKGLMLDSRSSCIHKTPVPDIVRRGHRLITFASDYEEFTGSSPWALDGASIQNFVRGDGVFHEVHTMEGNMKYLANAAVNNEDVMNQGGFSLMGMNTEGTSWQIEASAKHRFLHWLKIKQKGLESDEGLIELFSSCSSHIKIPGVSKDWCPETLLDISQLSSFYNQIAIESASRMIEQEIPGFGFPNAFYLDGLDFDGTIRTGTQLLNGSERSAPTASHKTSRYAYVDTILAYNIRKACTSNPRGFATEKRWTCYSLAEAVSKRKAKYPLDVWEQPAFGRHADWP